MKPTAVEFAVEQLEQLIPFGHQLAIRIILEQALEMEKQQQGYSEEEVLPLIEILQKCKEYFLLKTDKYSDERADAIIDVMEQFKKK